ncbi:hypothetical protein G6F32_014219 [Rhizopus arrhizus]|nr:hypothetical protein G6F32_014219 [Rhizopus arrhizus]
MVIEIDDAGRFHWPGQFDRLQHWLAVEPAGLPVVVFINGWHHNASPTDSRSEAPTADLRSGRYGAVAGGWW